MISAALVVGYVVFAKKYSITLERQDSYADELDACYGRCLNKVYWKCMKRGGQEANCDSEKRYCEGTCDLTYPWLLVY